jgi:predicted AAA+ superfamily ATPase
MMLKRTGPTWTPSLQDFQQVFSEQNPWHTTGRVPEVLAPATERPLAQCFWHRLLKNDPRRFQLLLGPRRVGKTTCLYQTVQHLLMAGIQPDRLWWFRLDHPLLMRVDLGDLVRFVISSTSKGPQRQLPHFLFLDELTYARDWDRWLKTFYDEKWPVCIAGSSSSSPALRQPRFESGVGRWEEQYLAPYLFGEYLELKSKAVPVPVEERLDLTIGACLSAPQNFSALEPYRKTFLLTGGFPELLIGSTISDADIASSVLQSQRTLRSDAVERAIYKDIPQEFGVDNPMMLERLLYTLAGQLTGILSPQTICGALETLSQATLDRYLSYLDRAYLIFLLQNYSGSEASRQKRGRKLFFVDGAVRNAALQRGLLPINNSEEMGLLMENMAASHLHALGEQSEIRLYHWRDGNDEVDLIFDHPDFPLAFEIGSDADHHRRGLHALMNRHPRFVGKCYMVAPKATPQSPADRWDKTGTLSLDLLLLAVSAQAALALRARIGAPVVSSPPKATPYSHGDIDFGGPIDVTSTSGA